MSSSTNLMTWVTAPYAGGFLSRGQTKTVALNITQGWEAQVMAGVVFGTSVSNAQDVSVYRSTDGGANYESVPLYAFSISQNPAATDRVSFNLSTGQYILGIEADLSTNSLTVFFPTYAVITSIESS